MAEVCRTFRGFFRAAGTRISMRVQKGAEGRVYRVFKEVFSAGKVMRLEGADARDRLLRRSKHVLMEEQTAGISSCSTLINQ